MLTLPLHGARHRPHADVSAGLVISAVLTGLCGSAQAQSQPPDQPVLGVRIGGAWLAGLSPDWWETPRDRAQIGLSAVWRPADTLTLAASFDALRVDRYEDGSGQSGPGDLSLFTELELWPGAVTGHLSWSVKLPDADDERELGSDETDVRLAFRAETEPGPVRLDGRLGLAVLGDPHHATTQAWVPELGIHAAVGAGPVSPMAALDARIGSARLPARATAQVGLEARCPVLVGASASVGLSAAGPAYGATGWLGLGAGCDGPGKPQTRGQQD